MEHWVRRVLEGALWSKEDVTDETWADLNRIIQLIERQDVHHFRTSELEKLADDISACTDLTTLSRLMWELATSVGFQHFVIFALSQGSCTTFKSRICTSFSDDWITRYQQKGYQSIDPILAKAMKSDGWFRFSDIKETEPLIDSFWSDAESHRIGRNGLCFAATRPDGSRIGISFLTSNSENAVNKICDISGFDLQVLAQLAAEAFCYLTSGPPLTVNTLSIEELRFLHVLTTSANPEDALKISAHFGSNSTLQASIRKKLGVKTIFQAVSVVVSNGWFSQLPYTPSDVEKSFPRLTGIDIILDGLDYHREKSDPDSTV